MSAEVCDVAVIGGGPAGATCAALCAASGLRVAVMERAIFPRDKVCGDCLNPSCWPILERLGVADLVVHSPHARIETVEITGLFGARSLTKLPMHARGELTIKRRFLDDLLLRRAEHLGAKILTDTALTALARDEGGWQLQTSRGPLAAHVLVAADGRNSTTARLLGLQPKPRRDRVGLQTHFPLPSGLRGQVSMRFRALGYCGVADIGGGLANLCVVARPRHLAALRAWAEREFALLAGQEWRTITPLTRAPISPAHARLLLIGDAARVVEPFTGEGIYYALASGQLGADFLVEKKPLADFAAAHRALYRGRLWVNILAREACLHPRLASVLMRVFPRLPGALTRKVSLR